MKMEYRRLGNSGLKVSNLGLGTNAFGGRADKATSIAIVHAALERGVTLIDTANVYVHGDSEAILGEALQGRRTQAVLSTKAGLSTADGPYNHGCSRRHLTEQLHASLSRLKTDYLDLFYVHTFDEDTPLDETLRTLDEFVRQGKVRYVGASNYFAWELALALGMSDRKDYVRFCAVQPSYSLADRTPETELVPLCLNQGVGLVAYFPLAGGILTGKYQGGAVPVGSRLDTTPSFSRMMDSTRSALSEKITALSLEMNCHPAALSLAWLTHQPGVSSAIVGATSVKQLEQNLEANDILWSDTLNQKLNAVSAPFIDGPKFGWYRNS